jgi:sugar O-acyltransferase (sialic acid O-acetyltransferase NeuD family)
MKKPIILVGGGGHCKSCIDVIEQSRKYNIVGIVDIAEKLHQKILGYEIIATDDDLPSLVKEYDLFCITIGHINTPEPRIKLFQFIKILGGKFPVIVSPLAYVSPHAKIGKGTIIMHYALVNAGANVGENCILNTRALVEHDAIIEDHCHISTGAIINGGTIVKTGTFFGSNAVSKEYIETNEFAFIKAGEIFTGYKNG